MNPIPFQKQLNTLLTDHIQGHILLIGGKNTEIPLLLGQWIKHQHTRKKKVYWVTDSNYHSKLESQIKKVGLQECIYILPYGADYKQLGMIAMVVDNDQTSKRAKRVLPQLYLNPRAKYYPEPTQINPQKKNPEIPQDKINTFWEIIKEIEEGEMTWSVNELFQLFESAHKVMECTPEGTINILDIGVGYGVGAYLMAMACQEYDREVSIIGIDPYPQISEKILSKLGKKLTLIKGYPHKVVEKVKNQSQNQPLSMVICDGDPTELSIKLDVLNYAPLLTLGGVLVAHHYYPEWVSKKDIQKRYTNSGPLRVPGVRKVCDDILIEQQKWETITPPLLYLEDVSPSESHMIVIPDVCSTVEVYKSSNNSD